MTRRRWWSGDDRGSASMQLVVLMPVMFAAMFIGVQGAVWYHARTIAYAAAQQGAAAAAAENATTGAATSAASSFVHHKGGDVLTAASVHSHRSAATATVTVSGTVLSVLPGLHFTVHQTAAAPVERLTQ